MRKTNRTPGKKRGEIAVRRELGSSVVDLRSWVSDYVHAVATYCEPDALDIQPIHHLPKAS